MQAFSHWTYHASNGYMMVTDLQGVVNGDVFWLCDPAIHCDDKILAFTKTNLGKGGYKLFFDTHVCNHVCKQLKLPLKPEIVL